LTGIGETLRQARVSRGFDLDQAAEATNIRVRYLGDLEDERFDRLPAPVYARSFLREYADVLGLDAEVLVARYEQEHRELAPPEIVARGATPLRRRRLPGRRPLAAIAVALAVLGVWAYGRGSDHSRASPPRVTALTPPATHAVRAAPVTHRPPQIALLRAANGDCWVSVHVGSQSGALVREGTPARRRDAQARPATEALGAA
jgi:cytoskeleton protein RodZ